MKTNISYIAQDGKVFTDAQECLEYEERMKNFPSARFFSNSFREEEKCFQKAKYLIIFNEDFLNTVEDKKVRENLNYEIKFEDFPCYLIKGEDGRWREINLVLDKEYKNIDKARAEMERWFY